MTTTTTSMKMMGKKRIERTNQTRQRQLLHIKRGLLPPKWTTVICFLLLAKDFGWWPVVRTAAVERSKAADSFVQWIPTWKKKKKSKPKRREESFLEKLPMAQLNKKKNVFIFNLFFCRPMIRFYKVNRLTSTIPFHLLVHLFLPLSYRIDGNEGRNAIGVRLGSFWNEGRGKYQIKIHFLCLCKCRESFLNRLKIHLH